MTDETAVSPDGETATRLSGRREPARRWTLRTGAAGAAAVGAGRAVLLPALSRQGLATPDGIFDAAASREDLAALDPSESAIVYRDVLGPYVAHCHSLMHGDHAMMFGWTIVP